MRYGIKLGMLAVLAAALTLAVACELDSGSRRRTGEN